MSGYRYIGIDYSGAAAPTTGLGGLRVFLADDGSQPREIRPTADGRRHWTRAGLASWLGEVIVSGPPALIGIDHGLSFPLAYFEKYGLPHDWERFLGDFRHHWPTDGDEVTVESIRRLDPSRTGSSRWRRLVEVRAGGAKSVFHFDVPGSVAKSTHAGLPWILALRRQCGRRLHCWPFDGWDLPRDRSVITEVWPALWSGDYPRQGRGPDQHDAFSVAARLRDADLAGRLSELFSPPAGPADRRTGSIEGWIPGVSGD